MGARLVRHGHLPEREVMTGIGPVPVKVPRVRDRGQGKTRSPSRPASCRGICARQIGKIPDRGNRQLIRMIEKDTITIKRLVNEG